MHSLGSGGRKNKYPALCASDKGKAWLENLVSGFSGCLAPGPVPSPLSRVAHTTDIRDAIESHFGIIFGNYCKSYLMEDCGFLPL